MTPYDVVCIQKNGLTSIISSHLCDTVKSPYFSLWTVDQEQKILIKVLVEIIYKNIFSHSWKKFLFYDGIENESVFTNESNIVYRLFNFSTEFLISYENNTL